MWKFWKKRRKRFSRCNKCISLKQAKDLIEKGVYLLDVRTTAEYNYIHLENAINIPVAQIMHKSKLLPENKEEKILVYCTTGVRSENAISILESMGYNNVYMWRGGCINDILN